MDSPLRERGQYECNVDNAIDMTYDDAACGFDYFDVFAAAVTSARNGTQT